MPRRPTGTLTLLFSDIEGSTRLWEQSASSMAIALKRHDEVLRSSIEGSGGYVFKTVGDAFCGGIPHCEGGCPSCSGSSVRSGRPTMAR
jgi:class 3 adenylate cyclase